MTYHSSLELKHFQCIQTEPATQFHQHDILKINSLYFNFIFITVKSILHLNPDYVHTIAQNVKWMNSSYEISGNILWNQLKLKMPREILFLRTGKIFCQGTHELAEHGSVVDLGFLKAHHQVNFDSRYNIVQKQVAFSWWSYTKSRPHRDFFFNRAKQRTSHKRVALSRRIDGPVGDRTAISYPARSFAPVPPGSDITWKSGHVMMRSPANRLSLFKTLSPLAWNWHEVLFKNELRIRAEVVVFYRVSLCKICPYVDRA